MITQNQMIYTEIETIQGTDPTPASTDFLAIHNLKVTPNIEYHSPQARDESLSPRPGVLGTKTITITFDHEIQVNNSAQTVPPCDALLQACGWDDKESATATDGKYYPASVPALKCIKVPFDTGTGTVAVGDTVTGTDSGATGICQSIAITSGAWAADAAGWLYLSDIIRTPGAADLTTGAGLDDLTMAGTYTGTANTTFVITLDENGGVATTDDIVDPTEVAPLINGVHTGVTLTGGTGTSCVATVTVAGGTITAVTPTTYGEDYVVNDTLTLSDLAAQGGGGDDDGTCDVATLGDVYSWTQDGGGATSNVLCAIAAATLADGVTVSFAAITGHTKTDAWTITCNDTYENNELLTVSGTECTVDGTQISPSCTIWAFHEDTVYKINGCKGNVVFNLTAGGIAIASFTLTGEYVKAADDTFPTTVTDDGGAPLVAMNNTFTWGSENPCVESMSFSLNNVVSIPKCMSKIHAAANVQITDREPSVSWNPEMTVAADIDVWTPFEAVTQTAISYEMTNSTVDFTISLPKVEISGINPAGEQNGVMTYELTGVPNRTTVGAGDDEMSIQFSAT